MRRRARRSNPERVDGIVGRVVGDLGGALLEPRPEGGRLEEVVDAEVAGRAEVVYRNGELRVFAATSADATVLKFERSKLAEWARSAYGLAQTPEIVVLVGRPTKSGERGG